jgi:zinc transporter ZupT
LFAFAMAGAALGIRLAEIPSISRRVLPFSGGLLIGVAGFWIGPEIAERYGWAGACFGVAAGFAALWIIDRYAYPVCPLCSPVHAHEHDVCAKRLHGFAWPLVIAAGVHSFFDGWSLGIAQQKGLEDLRAAFFIGVGVHKIPEGIALGVLLLAATGSPRRALLSCAVTQFMMPIGGLAALSLAKNFSPNWTMGFLALVTGFFFFLGYHAIHSSYRERGVATTVMPALTGAIGAAALRSFLPGI